MLFTVPVFFNLTATWIGAERRQSTQACRRSDIADGSYGASIGNDFTKGQRGMARSTSGAKKFVRSRFRFHEKAATRKLANEAQDHMES
ncbi:hypothetical protein D3C71_1804440 [compost metagenome]